MALRGMPVSSRSSRAAAVASGSPVWTRPPGSDHRPLLGGLPRFTSSTCVREEAGAVASADGRDDGEGRKRAVETAGLTPVEAGGGVQARVRVRHAGGGMAKGVRESVP